MELCKCSLSHTTAAVKILHTMGNRTKQLQQEFRYRIQRPVIGQSTKELAILALECTELRHRDRTDLKTQILPVLEKLRVVAEKAWNLASIAPIGSPNHFICPILKKAIEEWLAENDTSPVTNLSLLHKSLIPNYTLQLEWKSGKH
ncbi:E3 ubiquitin ligase [Forsythia ovata]|uniref:RING-type E3 ubiquitin transferase n=1 Tax=Forsythia ovata TaxID=205694 RepID=A0ABD1WKV3_9LAMI